MGKTTRAKVSKSGRNLAKTIQQIREPQDLLTAPDVTDSYDAVEDEAFEGEERDVAILKNDSALPSTTITYHISSPHHASETLNPQLCDDEGASDVSAVPAKDHDTSAEVKDHEESAKAKDHGESAVKANDHEETTKPNGKRKAADRERLPPKKLKLDSKTNLKSKANRDSQDNLGGVDTEQDIEQWLEAVGDLPPLPSLAVFRANIAAGGTGEGSLSRALPVPAGYKKEYFELVGQVAEYDASSGVYSLKPEPYSIAPIKAGSEEEVFRTLLAKARAGQAPGGGVANRSAADYGWLYGMISAVYDLHVRSQAAKWKKLVVEFKRDEDIFDDKGLVVAKKEVVHFDHYVWGGEVIPHLLKLLVAYEQVLADYAGRQDIVLDFSTVIRQLGNLIYKLYEFTKKKPLADKATNILKVCYEQDISYMMWTEGFLFIKQQENNTYQAPLTYTILNGVKGFKVMPPDANGQSDIVYINWRRLNKKRGTGRLGEA